ncbi:ABC transporter permease [Salsuginibacillus kocurii]|uniref:ABC transporter permease n=1 Tax=Salsuginibacillus kocurii TaxID=427078 RepID=UPI00036680B0|nr:ABC transporter permease [Salsuginibacillus kocurii]
MERKQEERVGESLTLPNLSQSKPAVNQRSKMTEFVRRKALQILPSVTLFVVFFGAWELILRLADIAPFIFPKPSDIVVAAQGNWVNLLGAAQATTTGALAGFAISTVLAISMAIILSLSKWIEKSVYPYIVILQTIPIVAVIPIIVIWFGAGIQSIIIVVFLISFFPILTNTLIGLNSTDQNMKNLFYLYNASRFQTIFKLRIPAALPYIVAGLKISCTLAFIGAIVGEYMAGIGGAEGGLGQAITVAATRLETPYLFACGLTASLLSVTVYQIVTKLSERMLSSWHESEMK